MPRTIGRAFSLRNNQTHLNKNANNLAHPIYPCGYLSMLMWAFGKNVETNTMQFMRTCILHMRIICLLLIGAICVLRGSIVAIQYIYIDIYIQNTYYA